MKNYGSNKIGQGKRREHVKGPKEKNNLGEIGLGGYAGYVR